MSWLVFSSIVACVSNLAISAFVFLRASRNPIRLHFSLMALSLAIWATSDFATQALASSNEEALFWVRFSYVGALFLAPSFLGFVLSLAGGERKLAIRIHYALSSTLLTIAFTPLLIRGAVRQPYTELPGPFYNIFVLQVIAAFLYGAARLFVTYRNASPIHRNQIRYVLAATTAGMLALAIYFLVTYQWKIPPLHYVVEIGVVLTLASAIVRHRLMDVRLAITRTAVFMAVYALALGLPLIPALAWQPRLEGYLGSRWWIWLWGVCALLATGAHYANLYVQRFAERRLLLGQRKYQATLRQASEGMTRIRELSKLLDLTVRILARAVGLTHTAIYLEDVESKQYVLEATRGGSSEAMPAAVDGEDPLIKYLLALKDAVVLEEVQLRQHQGSGAGLHEIEFALRRLGAAVVIPSFVHEHLFGFVVMGAKRSGEIYTDDDLKVLLTLASQAALAIENARFYEAEKKRQAEMFHTAQLASLGTLAGGMGHQINNRFHVEAVMAGTYAKVWETVDAGAVPESLRELVQKTTVTLKKIENDAIRGGDIVKTLLSFSKPGKMDQIKFPSVIEMAKELAQYRVDFQEIDYETVMDNPLPEIRGNQNQLAETFFNLMTNAYDAIRSKAEAIQEGRVKMAGDKPYRGRLAITVTSSAKDGATWLEMVVQDNGTGVKADDLPRLFVPFYTTKATSEKGTGLGLYVIKRIIENHGGKIEVSSVYGQGTIFMIRLPAAGSAG